MKKIILFVLVLNLSASSFSNPFVVADTMRINGHLALWLGSGNDYEDGFNYGMLLGFKLKPLLDNYLIPTFGGATGYNQARQIFDQYFVVDDKYIEMTQGMISGMEMAGIDLYSAVLDDTLTYKDILIANSVTDFQSFSAKWHNIGPGCSSLTSWGEATMNAPELMGETVIVRNLDWDTSPHLINNALIIIWVTADPAKQSFVTFGFVGLIGALSGMNEYGVATFHNDGNYMTFPTGTGFYPVNLAQRNGLEAADYNDDGICSPRDVTAAVKAHNVANSHIIHSAGPSFMEPAAEILEIHNSFGYAIRTKANNPVFFGDNLVATNHFQLLKPATGCSRYNRIRDSLLVSNQLDVNRNWTVLKTAGVSWNLQTIQFIPTQNIIRFSFAQIGVPAYLIEPTEVWMDTLFTMFNVGINEMNLSENNHLNIFPNPGKDLINIVIEAETGTSVSILIRNLNGTVVYDRNERSATSGKNAFIWETKNLAAGVYFAEIEIKDEKGGKVLNETKKIVVTK